MYCLRITGRVNQRTPAIAGRCCTPGSSLNRFGLIGGNRGSVLTRLKSRIGPKTIGCRSHGRMPLTGSHGSGWHMRGVKLVYRAITLRHPGAPLVIIHPVCNRAETVTGRIECTGVLPQIRVVSNIRSRTRHVRADPLLRVTRDISLSNPWLCIMAISLRVGSGEPLIRHRYMLGNMAGRRIGAPTQSLSRNGCLK
jgi:hypothetical protein